MEFGAPKASSQRRLVGLGAVAVFHGLLIWALVAGLARKAIEILPAPIETKIIEEVKPPEEVPPPPPPKLDIAPPPFIPPPEINIARPPPAHAITAQSKAPAAPRALPTVALHVSGRGCREPDYPSISQRLGEHGSVMLQLLVGTDGRVKDSKIARSSGYPRLDEAARKGLSLCKFEPAIVDGKPTPAWGSLKYTFKLPD